MCFRLLLVYAGVAMWMNVMEELLLLRPSEPRSRLFMHAMIRTYATRDEENGRDVGGRVGRAGLGARAGVG
jgi:hypothetical protein